MTIYKVTDRLKGRKVKCIPNPDSKKWADFETEHAEELGRIAEIRLKGHTHHCAWGSGKCTCRIKEDLDADTI